MQYEGRKLGLFSGDDFLKLIRCVMFGLDRFTGFDGYNGGVPGANPRRDLRPTGKAATSVVIQAIFGQFEFY